VASSAATGLIRYRLPQLAAGRFVARHTLKTGALWGAVFGLYVYSTAIGFNSLAPTAVQRDQLLNSLASNTGLKALLGGAHRITTRAGFVDWRVLGVASMVGAIWGMLLATKTLRGEEAAGRWEPFLAGQTTARRAAGNALAGLGAGLLAMFVLAALFTAAVGTRHNIGISLGQSLLFAAALVAGAAEFVAIGALASELMPTRARAASLAAAVFGVAFMLRVLGDSAPSWHWLVYLSPLGWVEQLRPLSDAQPLWLVPIAGLIALSAAATVYLAQRDLGASVLADKDTAAPRTALLESPVLFAVRLSWAAIAGWLAAAAVAAWLYGTLAKSAGKAFASSGMLRRFTGNLTDTAAHHLQMTGARLYASVVFLLLMTLVMAYVASAMGRAREEEAEGYLDNLVVRSVSRQRWLSGRIGLIVVVLVIVGLLGGTGFWVGAASQHSGLLFRELMLAGLNSAAPAAALLGIGVFTLGFAPRMTSIVCWGILGWAFLLDMLGSAIKVNHWVMDTSLLQHMALAPAVNPNWRIVGIYLAIGCAAAALGGLRFTQRDLQST
jgi:ABC-2 type transport system permease protein